MASFFSRDQVEAFSQRLTRLNESRHIEHVRFHMQPPATSHQQPITNNRAPVQAIINLAHDHT